MTDVDDAIATTAVALNEDAKAKRKSPAKAEKVEKVDKENPEEPIVDGEPGPETATGSLDLSEEAHSAAIEGMEAAATDYEIDQRALVPDVRDFMLDQIKCRPKPWGATSNAEQRDVASACEHAAVELIRKVVEAVAADPATSPIRCLLVGYSDKGDDIKVDLKVKALSRDETTDAVVALHKAKGKHVLVTVASVDDYRGEGRDPALDADEPPLDFEAGDAGFPDHPADDSDLRDEPEIVRSGDQVLVVGHGLREARVNLKSGMIEADVLPKNVGEPMKVVDVREATPAELAAERDRTADFGDEEDSEAE